MIVGLPKRRCERCGAEMLSLQTAPANPVVCMSCFDWCSPRPELPSTPQRVRTEAERQRHLDSVDFRFSNGDQTED